MSPRSETLLFALFIAIVTAIRFWFAARLGLSPDEAYYWQWSNDLSLTYPDHPPLVAWLIRSGTSLFGHNPLGVRFAFLVLGTMGIAVTYKIGRAVRLPRPYAAVGAALATLLPLPGVGTIIATPDTPLGLCWMLALLALIRLTRTDPGGALYLLGAAAGVGLMAKLTALLILVVAALGAGFLPQLRRNLRNPTALRAMLLFICIAVPYVIAEVLAGFPAIRFQFAHVTEGLGHSREFLNPLAVLERLLGLLGGQLGLLTPLVAGWTIVFLVRAKSQPQWTILALGFAVPVIAAAILGFTTHPEQNWASLGHPLAAIGVVLVTCQRKRAWLATTMGTVFVITLLIHSHALHPFLPLPPERDPVSRLHGWRELGTLKDKAIRADAVLCDNYGLAAQVAWQLRDQDVVVRSSDREETPPPGTWLLLDQKKDWKQKYVTANCKETRSLGRQIHRRGDQHVVRTVSVAEGRECDRMQGAPDWKEP